jgi:ubiquinone/menaquinone biosynthesis C-methylase UbiE
MIEIAKYKAHNLDIENMEIEQIDLFSTKLENKQYNLIITSLVLHHIVDIQKIIKRFYELVKADDGYICIVDINKEDGSFHKNEQGFIGHNGFDPSELEMIAGSFGFKPYHQKTFYSKSKNVNGKQVDYSLFILVLKKGR